MMCTQTRETWEGMCSCLLQSFCRWRHKHPERLNNWNNLWKSHGSRGGGEAGSKNKRSVLVLILTLKSQQYFLNLKLYSHEEEGTGEARCVQRCERGFEESHAWNKTVHVTRHSGNVQGESWPAHNESNSDWAQEHGHKKRGLWLEATSCLEIEYNFSVQVTVIIRW